MKRYMTFEDDKISFKRFAILEDYGLTQIESASDKILNETVKIAKLSTGFPVALLSLVGTDKVYFKAKENFENCEGDAALSLCSYALTQNGSFFSIEDTSKDNKFKHHPYVTGDPGIGSYYGKKLFLNDSESKDKIAIGTICIIDTQARKISNEQLQILLSLSAVVENHFKTLRYNNNVKITVEHFKNYISLKNENI